MQRKCLDYNKSGHVGTDKFSVRFWCFLIMKWPRYLLKNRFVNNTVHFNLKSTNISTSDTVPLHPVLRWSWCAEVRPNWHLNICQQRSSAAMQEHRPWLLTSTKVATRLGWVAGTWAYYIDGPATTHTHSLSGVWSGGLQSKKQQMNDTWCTLGCNDSNNPPGYLWHMTGLFAMQDMLHNHLCQLAQPEKCRGMQQKHSETCWITLNSDDNTGVW